MRELPRVQAKHVPRRDRRAHRADHARRVESDGTVMAGVANPPRQFDALDQRGDKVAAGNIVRLSQRQNGGQRGGQRVVRRVPHRLEIQHVHRRTVQHGGAEAEPKHRRVRRAAQAAIVIREDADRCLAAAGDRDGDAVQYQAARLRDGFGRERVERCRNDLVAKLCRDAHGSFSRLCWSQYRRQVRAGPSEPADAVSCRGIRSLRRSAATVSSPGA